MEAKLKADFVALTHLLLVIFVLFSFPLLFVFTWWKFIVLLVIGVTIVSWLILRDCWFLQLENKWRRESSYTESSEDEAYIQHYLRTIFRINISKQVVRRVNQIIVALLFLSALLQTFISQ